MPETFKINSENKTSPSVPPFILRSSAPSRKPHQTITGVLSFKTDVKAYLQNYIQSQKLKVFKQFQLQY